MVGFQRSFGIFFIEIRQRYNVSASLTSAVGGIATGCSSITAVFVMSFVINVISERQTILIGVFLMTAASVLSSFARSFSAFATSFGILDGLGRAFVFGPTFVILGKYFSHRLTIAQAFVTTGSSVGAMLLPFLYRAILDAFFFPYGMLIVGGVTAQLFACACVFFPVSRSSGNDVGHGQVAECSLDDLDQLSEQSKVELDECVRGKTDCQTSNLCIENVGLGEAHLNARNISAREVYLGMEDGVGMAELNMQSKLDIGGRLDIEKGGVEEVRPGLKNIELQGIESVSKNVLVDNRSYSDKSSDVNLSSDDQGELDNMVRQPVKRCMWCNTDSALTFGVLRKVEFWPLVFSQGFGFLLGYLGQVFLPPLAKEKGLTDQEAANLLSLIGCLDIGSRLVPGIIAHRKLAKPQTMVIFSLTVLGFISQFVQFYNSIIWLVAFSTVFGCFSGIFFAMQPAVVTFYMGKEGFPFAFGFVQLLLGGLGAFSYTILGALKDWTGTYSASYHYLGATSLLSAILLACLPCIRQYEIRRKRHVDQ